MIFVSTSTLNFIFSYLVQILGQVERKPVVKCMLSRRDSTLVVMLIMKKKKVALHIDSKNRAEHDHEEKNMMNTERMLVIYGHLGVLQTR